MADFSLIKIDGKPLEKLIDVISKGIGTIYKPRAIKKEAEAKAYEIEIIERAKYKAIAEGKEIDVETLDKIQERFIYKETKRQNNIDNIAKIAAEQISQEEDVSEEPVDEDWSTRFFNIVEDVSDDEMQKLWGRILAGEVKQPKSFSLRTLELLKNLSKNEADVFMLASTLVISSRNSPFLFRGEDNDALTKYGFTFEHRLLLTELGILQAETNITRNFKTITSDYTTYFESAKYLIKSLKKANSEENNLPIYRFSKIGEELLKLINSEVNENYIKEFGSVLNSYNLDVEYAYIITKKNGDYTHTQPWLKF